MSEVNELEEELEARKAQNKLRRWPKRDLFQESFLPRYYRIAISRFRAIPPSREKERQIQLIQNELALESRLYEVDYSDLCAIERAIIAASPVAKLPSLREELLVRYRALAGDSDPIVLRHFQQASPTPTFVPVPTPSEES